MSIPHSYYEELCALAAAGQIAHDELATLREHTGACEECRCALVDFRYLASRLLEQTAAKESLSTPSDMASRFIARARSEGVPLSYQQTDSARLPWFPRLRLVAEFVGVILLIALSMSSLMMLWKQRYGPIKIQNDGSASSTIRSFAGEHDKLIRQLQALEARTTQSASEVAAKQAALDTARAEMQHIGDRLADLEQTDGKLQQDLAARDLEIAELTTRRDQLTADLEDLRSAKATEDLLFQANRSEVEDLRIKLTSLTEELNQRQDLSAAAEQAKDLIVARNLHIVDVHDNPAGNRPKPFGRIFYTEGRKLIFYAYDLGDNKSTAKVTFYVWGEKSGTTEEAKHLGILHPDDKREGRWVVTFDDPQVLAQINTVFVTAESPRKAPNKPSGNRILVAFLDGAPNHP